MSSNLSLKLVTFFILLNVLDIVTKVFGHGTMLQPIGRASLWRKYKEAKKNYQDDELFCGGFTVQWGQNGGKCGICGDNYADPVPRAHEFGGEYGEGVIVKTYKQPNDTIPVEINLTTSHLGAFRWHICNMDNEAESDECFEKYPVMLANDKPEYKVTIQGAATIRTNLRLPKDLKCKHCVLRWTYTAGNNWGFCEDGKGALGCGPQEHFRSCADISIE